MRDELLTTAAKGFTGVMFSAGGVGVSILPEIETWLRLTSLVVGLTVGLITLWSLLHKKK